MITTDANGAVTIDLKVLKETLNAEGGEQKVTDAFKPLKVFSNDQYISVLNNHKESLKSTLKDEFYKDHKRDIHGSLEKEIMKKYGLEELKPGTDFKTTVELLGLVEAKIKKEAGVKPDGTEITKYTDKIQELNSTIEKMVNKEEYEALQNDFYASILDLNVGGLSYLVDAEDDKVAGQLDYLKYKFISEGYKISKKDSTFVVLNKEGQVENDKTTFKPVPVSTFVQNLASKHLKLKEEPVGGRGANNKSTPANTELGSLKDKQAVVEYLQKKNIDITSDEGSKIYGEWLETQNKK